MVGTVRLAGIKRGIVYSVREIREALPAGVRVPALETADPMDVVVSDDQGRLHLKRLSQWAKW